MTGTSPIMLVPPGILFSQNVLQSGALQFLAALVAVNTIMDVALAFAKMLPKVHPSAWRPGHSRRSGTRNIDPDHRLSHPCSVGRTRLSSLRRAAAVGMPAGSSGRLAWVGVALPEDLRGSGHRDPLAP